LSLSVSVTVVHRSSFGGVVISPAWFGCSSPPPPFLYPPTPPPATVLISATHPAKRCRLVSCFWCVLVVWSCWSFASFSCMVVRWLCGFVCVALWWCCFAVVGVAVLCCSAPELLWCCVAPVVCVGVWCVCRVWSLCGVLVCVSSFAALVCCACARRMCVVLV